MVDRDLSRPKGAEVVNRSRLMLLVASLESLLYYLYLLLLILMVNDSMLRELKLRLFVEGLRLAMMKYRRARVIQIELMIKSLITITIRSHII